MKRDEFFDQLIDMSPADLLDVQSAYWLAKESHRTQKPRDGGERYFEHPKQVAGILIGLGYRDKGTVIKGLLHDSIEDTTLPRAIIVNLFGEAMWHSLALLSKSIPVFHPQTGQIIERSKKPLDEYWRFIATAPPLDRAVKLADRHHNLLTIDIWEPARQLKYCAETRTFAIPIANETDWWLAEQLEKQVRDIELRCAAA